MFRIFILLMIVLPASEIWLLIQVGQQIGGWNTFLIILVTAAVGAYLTKREAARVWQEAMREYQNGRIPGRHLLDGLCIFAGGLLLLTPGFMTDTLGFLLVFPPTRAWFRLLLLRWMQQAIAKGTVRFIRKK